MSSIESRELTFDDECNKDLHLHYSGSPLGLKNKSYGEQELKLDLFIKEF